MRVELQSAYRLMEPSSGLPMLIGVADDGDLEREENARKCSI